MERLHRAEPIAKSWGVSVGPIYKEHRLGRLPGVRIGKTLLFTEADLTAYLDRRREESRSEST